MVEAKEVANVAKDAIVAAIKAYGTLLLVILAIFVAVIGVDKVAYAIKVFIDVLQYAANLL